MKITIVTASFNSAKTIKDTLDSVAMQTHTDIEHLVIDGASKDGTLEIVRSHTSKQIRLISEPDEGIYDAMNKGFIQAKGEVVGFLNSDDFYADASVLEKIAFEFQDPAVDACYGDLVYVTQDKRRIVRYWKSKPFSKGDFAKGWCPAHPTFYVRTSLIERLGLFDRSYKMGVDVEFMMRYLECGQIGAVYIPHVLVRMRLGGVSNQSWLNIFLQNMAIFAALRKNGVPFSILRFTVNKLASRLWQFTAGRVWQH
jgi:glycosyltransferase involved in cell wall biosynthesis